MYDAIKREVQKDKADELEKFAVDASKYLGHGRLFQHMAGGAALGGGTGALIGDPGERQNSALRGAMYGAAGGVGFSHKTAPVVKKRLDEMQKFEKKHNSLKNRVLARVLPGAKAKMTAKAEAHMKALMAGDKQEMLGEGLTGAGFGLGLGITAGTVADRMRGQNTQQPTTMGTPFAYS